MKYITYVAALMLLFLISCHIKTEQDDFDPSLVLWYDKPAVEWTEALPLGNGSIGAMVYGRPEKEIIQFNEETLWTGQPHNYAHRGAYRYLNRLRKLLWDGEQQKAEELANKHFMSQPFGQQAYQPFGNIEIYFPGHSGVKNYRRSLNLENAISTVSYKADRINYKREIFVSNPDKALVVHLTAGKKERLNFTVGLNSPHDNYSVSVEENKLILRGKANNYPKELGADGKPYPESKLNFESNLQITINDGYLTGGSNSIKVTDATSATLILVAATNFVDYNNISADPGLRCREELAKLNGKSFEDLKSEHIRDYQRLFKRVKIDLGVSQDSNRPTNERLDSFNQNEDPNLVALLYQYGRYLLISSSREGSQPANLQGIWNDKLAPPWDSKYTININTEMNYWPAEITNLSECTAPLIRMVQDLSETGKSVAKEHYNMNGWVAHHNTDLWRGAAPINNSNHGIWVTGGAWLCQHLWWHYQFEGDIDYLKNTAYPVLKEASGFFCQYLVPDPNHPEWLVSGPSNSPENGGLVMGPTMDHQIIRNLMANTIEAAEILGVDTSFIDSLAEIRLRIAPNQIGRYGQLQEWLEDRDDPDSEHRHVSHLWGLHPGNEISPKTTPELARACKVTLAHRGDGGTGWSRAWKINFWARLLDGDHSFLLLKNLMVPSKSEKTDYKDSGGLYYNLFDAHPPFQIDGNFGATSGITEMLLQSHLRDENGGYYLDLLPALPAALRNGSVSGLKARGGFEVGISWSGNKLLSVKVKSFLGNKLNLRYDGGTISRETTTGKTYVFTPKEF